MARNPKSSPLFILAAMITALAVLYFAREILLPVALAILLSFLLTPLADRLERWRFPRAAAVMLVVAMSFAVLGGLGWIVTDQLVDLSHQLPANKQNLIAKTQWVSTTLNKVRDEISRVGRLHQSSTEMPTNGEKQTDAQTNASGLKKPSPAEVKPSNPSLPLTASAKKLDEAGKIIETSTERDAVP